MVHLKSFTEPVEGSTIKFNNLLNKDEAELIGPGIQIYLDGLQTFGTIQVRCAL